MNMALQKKEDYNIGAGLMRIKWCCANARPGRKAGVIAGSSFRILQMWY
jgi:hypothetical protein